LKTSAFLIQKTSVLTFKRLEKYKKIKRNYINGIFFYLQNELIPGFLVCEWQNLCM